MSDRLRDYSLEDWIELVLGGWLLITWPAAAVWWIWSGQWRWFATAVVITLALMLAYKGATWDDSKSVPKE